MPSHHGLRPPGPRPTSERCCPPGVPRIAVEMGVTDGWWKYGCAAVVGIDTLRRIGAGGRCCSSTSASRRRTSRPRCGRRSRALISLSSPGGPFHDHQDRHQRLRPHRPHGVSRRRAELQGHRGRRHQRPARARLPGLHAAVRLGARPLQGRRRGRRQHAGRQRQADPPDAGEGSGRPQVGRGRRRRRDRVDRPLPHQGDGAEAPRRRREEGRSCPRPSKDDTPMFVFGVNDKTYKGEAIISNASLHHQLPGAAGQGAERQVGHQARPDDHRARRHRDAEDRRRPEQQGLARRPRHPREHHPVVHRRGQGGGRGDPRAEQEAHRHVLPRADLRRLGGRPDGRTGQGGELQGNLRRDEGAVAKAR